MNELKRKSLVKFFDESEGYERQLDQIEDGKDDESSREPLFKKIDDWLQDAVRQGVFIPGASADRRALNSLIGRWSSRLRAHGHPIEGPDRLADFNPKAGIVLKVKCPYPGLDPYGESHRGSFFGREKLVSDSVKHLEQEGNRILLIVGGSGSGKSSAAMAGILPQLGDKYGEVWHFCERLTPGPHPLAELAKSVASAIGLPDQIIEIKKGLADNPGDALGCLAGYCSGKPLMLFIDQFEEMFTLCLEEDERDVFAQVLWALSDPSDPNVSDGGFCCKVLLTMRTDHFARLEVRDAFKPLKRRLKDEKNSYDLYDIDYEDIKRAIRNPADQVGLRFVPEQLIDQLASQTDRLANGLPLLQFSLGRLWDMRPKNVSSGEPLDLVTEEMVNDLPHVAGALGKVADEAFSAFSSVQQGICDRLLQELLVLDESFEEPLRRRRNENELRGVLLKLPLEPPPSPADVARVIEEFVEKKLLRRFGDKENRHLEVAHEALLRHWGHIRDKLNGAEVKERLHHVKKIGREAADWVSHEKSSDYLKLKGGPLQSALNYAKDDWLAEAEAAAYVEACKSQKDEEGRRNRRASWWLYGWYSAACVAVLAVAIFAVYFIWVKPAEEMQRIVEASKRIVEASNHISHGFYLLQAEDPRRAEDRFKKTEELVKDLPLVKLGNGLACMRKEEYNKAKEYFVELIKYVNKEQLINQYNDQNLYTYYYQKGKACYAMKEYVEATKSFEEAIKLMEKSNAADDELMEKSNADDNERMEKIKAADNNKAEYYYYRGLSNIGQNQFDEAKKDFDKGIALGPKKHSVNRYGLGQVYFMKGDYRSAVVEFKEAIRLSKSEPNYRIDLGLAYLYNGNRKEAIEVFNNLVEEDPNNASVWLFLSQAYVDLAKALKKENLEAADEHLESAEKAAHKALDLYKLSEKDQPKAHALLGDALLAQGKYEAAIEAYKRAQVSNQQDAFLPLYLAEAYSAKQNIEEARYYVNEAEKLANKHPQQLQDQQALNFFNKKLSELKGKIKSP